MATVIFDFDSTVISCESLEKILKESLQNEPEKIKKIHEITKKGICGQISFDQSLRQRLEIAQPTLSAVKEFGNQAINWITPGIEVLFQDLIKQGVDIWLVSGGILESLLPVAKKLGVPEKNVKAVRLLWTEQGDLLSIDSGDPFSFSKLKGSELISKQWTTPTVMVGDSFSDWRLYDAGLVDHFILYTEHLRCKEILDKGVVFAENVDKLKEMIDVVVRERKN